MPDCSRQPVPQFAVMSIRALEPNDASDHRSENAARLIRSYTARQGQYLAFIYYYSKIHLCSPSEADMQRYFRVSPPAVHQMVLSMESWDSSRGRLVRAARSSCWCLAISCRI